MGRARAHDYGDLWYRERSDKNIAFKCYCVNLPLGVTGMVQ